MLPVATGSHRPYSGLICERHAIDPTPGSRLPVAVASGQRERLPGRPVGAVRWFSSRCKSVQSMAPDTKAMQGRTLLHFAGMVCSHCSHSTRNSGNRKSLMNQRVPIVPTVPTQKSITPMRNAWPMVAAHGGRLGVWARGYPPLSGPSSGLWMRDVATARKC